MTARPMEEGREKAEAAAAWVIAHHESSTRAAFVARALLSLSAEVKGLREALEKIQGYCERRMSPPSFATHGKHIVPIVLAALSPIPTHADEQARATRSAPSSTLSKDTSK